MAKHINDDGGTAVAVRADVSAAGDVTWLLSAEASYVTGAILPVSGGR